MKRVLSIICAVALLCSANLSAFAATFSDVNEQSYGWALDQIEDMASKGIINGYPDGTFAPANGITKIEAMLLMARILGFTSSVYDDYKEYITDLYADSLKDYSIQYKNEISFLLYKNIFSLEEIVEMAEAKELSNALRRDEAAEFITRAVGDYEYVLENYNTDTGYADNSSISKKYAPFVKYVRDKGLMLGMTDTEFVPDYQVNRAQMAVMLYRVIEQQTIVIKKGTVNDYDPDNELLVLNTGSKAEKFTIDNLKTTLNGEIIDPNDYRINAEVILVYVDDVLVAVEALYELPEVNNVIKGQLKEIVLSTTKTLSVEDSATDKSEKYVIDDNCDVFFDNDRSALSSLRVKDYVTLSLDENEAVIRIDVKERTETFTDGSINAIDVNEIDVNITVEREDGKLETYRPDGDIIVKRNGTVVTLNDVLVGDTVTKCTLTYNKITALELKSDIANSTGVISEIVISAEPSIVITKGTYETRLPISPDVQIYVDGKISDLYALRVDMNATYETDSNTVKKIEVSSISEVNQFSGQVQVTNTAYGFVTITGSDGIARQIYIKNTTSITRNSNGATRTLKDIKVGDYLVVIGSLKNGAYVASTVVIID
ncbi:MAG: S-layer homology domain-containing protein [Clostridia bacterium]|nr:S-layer homology domain-containing protein [Clostridia bacterium]